MRYCQVNAKHMRQRLGVLVYIKKRYGWQKANAAHYCGEFCWEVGWSWLQGNPTITFQEDNTPKHTHKAVVERFRSKHVLLLAWCQTPVFEGQMCSTSTHLNQTVRLPPQQVFRSMGSCWRTSYLIHACWNRHMSKSCRTLAPRGLQFDTRGLVKVQT